jgi:hypothetical protein
VFCAPHNVSSSIVDHPGPSRESLFARHRLPHRIRFHQNKLEKVGVFLAPQKPPSNSPRFTSESPQTHHKKPRVLHHISAKPPAKTTLHHPEKNHSPGCSILSKTCAM